MPMLDITKQVRDFLNQLDPKRFRQIANKIFSLMDNPVPTDSRQLAGYPYRRADIGEYRIICRVEKDCLRVALVGKRNDNEIYEMVKRLM